MKKKQQKTRRRIRAAVVLSAAVAVTAHADTGRIQLVDSAKLKYFINEDITFATTSSASGAASEASFTAAIAATTMGGGTVMASLSDMFDGAMTLAISPTADTTMPATGSAAWTFYNQHGAARPNDACLAGGSTASTPSTLTGATFTASGFVGGEVATIAINRVTTDVTFMAADQTPADVASRINTAVGSTVATVSTAGAIVLSSPLYYAAMTVSGTAAAGLGFGAPVYDGGSLGNSREAIFADATIGGVRVNRRVFVPDDDSFMRQVYRFENTTAASVTFTVAVTNNLGSDSNTKIFATSSGDLVGDTTDQWIGSFQNWSGTTSSDPRIAFVLANSASPTKPVALTYADGDDNPYWIYSLTLAAGEVKSIVNYVVGSGSQADAQATATALLDPRARPAALRCLSAADLATIVNLPTVQCALPADTACDDGNANTTGDHCTAVNTCTGTPIPVDAGVTPDAGTTTPGSSSSGCGCTVAGASDAPVQAGLAAGFMAALFAFRKRRRAGRAGAAQPRA